MIDMTNNRVPYGLLTDEERGALHEHEKAGGMIEAWFDVKGWYAATNATFSDWVYRTVPLPAQRSEQSSLKTQDVIAWDRLPDWVEWVARDESEEIHAYDNNDPYLQGENDEWLTVGHYRRIDDFPGIVQIGTCDWKDSKQRRPRG